MRKNKKYMKNIIYMALLFVFLAIVLFRNYPTTLNINPEEIKCINSGGEVKTIICDCPDTDDFPNTCAVGYCSCPPGNGKIIKICECPSGMCFVKDQGCIPEGIPSDIWSGEK
ncbi:MAG: hypothetical protein ACTSV7_14885 [Candidatus Baldrarchaeia archaeon]